MTSDRRKASVWIAGADNSERCEKNENSCRKLHGRVKRVTSEGGEEKDKYDGAPKPT